MTEGVFVVLKKYEFTRYYGYLKPSSSGRVCFEVHLICPPKSSYYEYIGPRDAKLTDMLCIDDYILCLSDDLEVDFHIVDKFRYGDKT